ncbi:fibronectin type III domain-containing protein (plasmid) [Streptosporangium sandarakinum]|uniref:fibronectin type III domain-containing protein n=1 Tax=Streptosporangium sandarakinum TaxID=1260955 RepID=UPI003D90E486
MQERVYTTQTPSTSHTITFSPTAADERIVAFVMSYAGVTGVSLGYDSLEWASNTIGLRIYTKLSSGGDTSFSVSLGNSSDRLFIWIYVLSDATENYGSASGVGTSTSLRIGANEPIPPGCVMLLGVSQYMVGTDNSSVSWPSGFSHKGYGLRDWVEGTARRVWSSTAVNTFPGSSVSINQALVVNNGGTTYAWGAALFGPPEDETPPSVPSNLRLTGMTPTSVTVAWDASTDDTGVAGYGLYLNGIKAGGDQSARTKTFSSLVSGMSYNIQVDAVDAKGNRSEKAEFTVTPINDTTPPETPVVRVTSLGPGRITVAWERPYDQSAVVAYGVYLNGVKQGADQTAQTKTWTNLTPGAVYTIAVDALDLLGNRSVKGVKTVKAQSDTTAPTAPAGLAVVTASKTSVTLTWSASTDDNVGVAGYGLYLGSLRIADITSRVFTYSGLTPGVTYNLGVDAADDLGNRSARVLIQATTMEDLSGQAPPYEYVLYDWDRHAPLDSLPLQNVSFELTLEGNGQLTGDIPLYDEAYTVGRVEAATLPERTMLLVFRGEQFVGGFRVIDPQDYDSETGVLRITAEEVTGIYARRYVAFTGPRAGTLAHTEIVWLLEHNASPADKRWLTFDGVAGTVPVDREYRAEEFTRILDQVNDVAAGPGGFTWWVKPSWDAVNDRPRFTFTRVSRDTPPDTGLVLEYPGNVRRFSRSTRRGLATKTWGQLRRPDGGVMLSSVTKDDLHVDGWPLLEDVFQFDGVTSQEALNAETQRASAAAAGPKQLFEFVLAVTPNVRWWEWELGGNAQVVISDHLYPAKPDGAAGLDRAMTIVSLRVEPDSAEGELITITTGEHTVAVD